MTTMEPDMESKNPMDETEDAGWQWARVEVFGHRQHYGRIREVEQFGTKMVRIDVPNDGKPGEKGWTTLFYGGGSIFSVILTDEATVMTRNRPYEPAYRAIASQVDEDGDDLEDGGGLTP